MAGKREGSRGPEVRALNKFGLKFFFICKSTSFFMTESARELRVGEKYRLGKKIGHGSFGDIYLGEVQLFVYILMFFSI
jgi:hypothetical protein